MLIRGELIGLCGVVTFVLKSAWSEKENEKQTKLMWKYWQANKQCWNIVILLFRIVDGMVYESRNDLAGKI